MVKLGRLLRLGRMISYLNVNKSLQFGAKIGELLFLLVLCVHCIACGWFALVRYRETWIPPKDVDYLGKEPFYTGTETEQYTLVFLYAVLTLVGNDLLPTFSSSLEVMMAALTILMGCIIVGTVIGQFSLVLEEFNQKERKKREEQDMLQQVMRTLKVPEDIQHRV